MRKFVHLVLFSALLLGSLNLRAQNANTPDVRFDRGENYTLIQVLDSYNWPYDISNNKQHVVIQGFGAVDGYYWSEETGTLPLTGYPYAVSDDGIVAGTFTNGLGMNVAGLWNAQTQKWEFLGMNPDLPEFSTVEGDFEYNGAWSMTNDGSVVGVMQVYPDWSTTSHLWTKENGYTKISNGVSPQTRPNAISDNGKVVAGFAAHETKGEWTPCYWIDGEIYRFPHLFGEALNVSHNGKYVCGYLLNSKCFVYDIANDKLVEVENTLEPINSLSATCVTDNGIVFGHSDAGSPVERNAIVYIGGELMYFTKYLELNGIEEAANWTVYSVTNVTADGKTFIGGGVIDGTECSFVLTIETAACEAPRNLTYTINQENHDDIILNWEAPENDENVTYDIYINHTGAPFAEGISETTFTFDNMEPGEYQFLVRANYNNGECLSDISNMVRPTVYPCPENNKCNLTIEATDMYGDGWDFGYISIEGAASNLIYKAELSDGGNPNKPEMINLKLCPDTYQFTWIPGNWDEEIGFAIYFHDEELYRVNFGDIDTTFKKKPMFFEYELNCEPGDGIETPTVSESSVNIYPNPVNNKLFVSTNSKIEAISIYTITGVMVYNEKISNNVIDVTSLNSGIYFVKINTKEGEIIERFVKK
ncbi:MAG: T9SS type A sorting domain-containing protein [Bacteroidales bacterium]|nr:T9SS type A sorting domain-containing protein [Bacteroidales bacterium]